jgi:hypothetical protein
MTGIDSINMERKVQSLRKTREEKKSVLTKVIDYSPEG